MNRNRKFQGIWIPASLWFEESLNLTEKILLVEVNSLDHGPARCFASNNYFGKFFNLSPSRISHLIRSMVDKGFLVRIIKKDESEISVRELFLNPDNPICASLLGDKNHVLGGIAKTTRWVLRKQQGGIAKIARGYCENSKHIETVNNTVNNTEEKKRKAPPPFSEFRDYALTKSSTIEPSALKLKYESWIENNWRDGNDKKIKNWKTKLCNTIPYLPKKESKGIAYKPMKFDD